MKSRIPTEAERAENDRKQNLFRAHRRAHIRKHEPHRVLVDAPEIDALIMQEESGV